MCGIDQLRANNFIEAMPSAVRERLNPHLELIWMKMGDTLGEPTNRSGHVYFPVTAIISIVYVMQDGASGEVAQIGNEGMLGVSLFMGGQSRFTRAVVQSAGFAFRLKAQHLLEEFNRTGPMLDLLLRYSQALSTQTLQIAACNRRHRIDQQLCRWLLSSLDRLVSNELEITQEFLATILGVRREAVTIAARKLQDDGLIHCRRAHITVLDRAGLEARACECYQIVHSECGRLMPLETASWGSERRGEPRRPLHGHGHSHGHAHRPIGHPIRSVGFGGAHV
jgi:CRP-like cAMP-binding protein